jgi:hypothetical protein
MKVKSLLPTHIVRVGKVIHSFVFVVSKVLVWVCVFLDQGEVIQLLVCMCMKP